MSNYVDLSTFDNSEFSRGKPLYVELMWMLVQFLFVSSPLPGSKLRCFALKTFGATVGRHVVIKPRVRVKFPWRLKLGDRVWVGEGVWIDNLADVSIGDDACVSQGAYLCTGNHDWSSSSFDLVTNGITVANCAWIGAFSTIAPGVNVGEGAVLALAGNALTDLEPWSVNLGNPAIKTGIRVVKSK